MSKGITADFERWRSSVVLTDDQEQLVLGSTLGNMSIFRRRIRSTGLPSENATMEVAHVKANADYVNWKYSFFEDLVGTPPSCRTVKQMFPSQPGFDSPEMCSFRTFGLPALRPLFDMCYSNGGTRKITREWLEAIETPIAVAAWFMDSGFPMKRDRHIPYQVRITVPRAGYDEAELVREVLLWELCGIDAGHHTQAPGVSKVSGARGHHAMQIGKREDIRFLVDLVKPFVDQVPSMA